MRDLENLKGDDDQDAMMLENGKWADKIGDYVEDLIEDRKWAAEDVDVLFRGGNDEVGKARMEMFPRYDEEEHGDGEVEAQSDPPEEEAQPDFQPEA